MGSLTSDVAPRRDYVLSQIEPLLRDGRPTKLVERPWTKEVVKKKFDPPGGTTGRVGCGTDWMGAPVPDGNHEPDVPSKCFVPTWRGYCWREPIGPGRILFGRMMIV